MPVSKLLAAVQVRHVGLKGAIRQLPGHLRLGHLAGSGELQEPFEDPRPVPGDPVQVDVARVEGAEDEAAGPGAREEHVEPPLAAIARRVKTTLDPAGLLNPGRMRA